MKLILVSLILASFTAANSSEKVLLNEKGVIEISKNSNVPELEKIKATFLEIKANNLKAEDNLGTDLYGGYNYSETKEGALNSFQPVFSPVHQYQVGIRKNFRYGLQADLNASVDNRSAEGYDSIHTTTYNFGLNIDLWKNLFGKLTRNQLNNSSLNVKQSKIQTKINENVFRVSLRRIYWALIANKEKLKISERLFKTAKKQVKDAKKRQRNSIADASEVARYESQVSSREGSILLLKYERESLLKQMVDLLPELASKNIEIESVNIDKTIFSVLACTSIIGSNKTTPLNYTDYDELINLLKQIQSNQEQIDQSYDAIDLKLSTKFRKTGVSSDPVTANTYEGSYDGSLDNLEDGFSAGLMLTIPLGKKIQGSAEVIKKYNKKRLEANIKNIDTSLVSTHTQVSKSIKYLGSLIKAQRTNSKALKTRLTEMQKKFNQARIPVYQLVQDQDELLSSDLSIVDTQLAILNTVLDYFVVFSDTPCEFNKK